MSMQPKVLLLTRLVFSAVSLYNCVLAATAPSSYFEAPPHEQQTWGLLSTGTYLTEPAVGSAAASTHSLFEASQDSVLALEGTLHHTSSASSVQASKRANEGGPSGRPPSFTPRRLSFCLLLVISAGLLTALIKQVAAVPSEGVEKGPPLKPGEKRVLFPLRPSEDIRIIKGRERLEKVKKLLPAAERLAALLKSAEAGGLLKTVKTTLNAAQSHRNAGALESSVTTALTALQQLHQRATEKAKALSQADQLSVSIKEMGEWADDTNSIINGLQHEELQNAVKPFVGTFGSVLSDVKRIAERVKAKGERMSIKQRKFRNEGDGEVLFSTARNLECLYTSDVTGRRLLEFAHEMQECTLDTIKAVLVTEREIDAWGLDISLASLTVRHAQARSLVDAARPSLTDTSGGSQESPGEGPAESPPEAPDGEFAKSLKNLEKQLMGVGAVAGQLQENVLALRSASSLQAALASSARISDLLQQAEEFSKKGAAAAEDIKLPSDVLDSVTKDILERATIWLENFVDSENEVFSNVIGHAEASSENLAGAVCAGKAFIGVDMIKKQKRLMNEAARSARDRSGEIAAAIGCLKASRLLSRTTTLLNEVLGDIKAQREDKRAIWAAWQKFTFLQLMENNLGYINAVMGEVQKANQHQRLQVSEQAHYKELQKRFEAAKRRIGDADTPEEAAELAANARAAAVDLLEFLFDSSN